MRPRATAVTSDEPARGDRASSLTLRKDWLVDLGRGITPHGIELKLELGIP